MKHRCYFLSVICGMSMYSWYNYSLFDPINTDIFTPYYQNSLICLSYLLWDTYKMTLSADRTILYRRELVIHHLFSAITLCSTFIDAPLVMSNYYICEGISVMNYMWYNHPTLLKIYRTFFIVLVRMPLTLYMWLYYMPCFVTPYMKITQSQPMYFYSTVSAKCLGFFILYDLYILKQLYLKKNDLDITSKRSSI